MTTFNANSTTNEVIAGISLDGRFAVVTGASAGLGIETARVLAQEHCIYPQAVRWFAEGKLEINHGRVNLKGASTSQSVFPTGA